MFRSGYPVSASFRELCTRLLCVTEYLWPGRRWDHWGFRTVNLVTRLLRRLSGCRGLRFAYAAAADDEEDEEEDRCPTSSITSRLVLGLVIPHLRTAQWEMGWSEVGSERGWGELGLERGWDGVELERGWGGGWRIGEVRWGGVGWGGVGLGGLGIEVGSGDVGLGVDGFGI